MYLNLKLIAKALSPGGRTPVDSPHYIRAHHGLKFWLAVAVFAVGVVGVAFAAQHTQPEKNCGYPRQLSEYQWIDKECRIYTKDKIGIDVDQTCIEVRTAVGSLVVIPNPHNDDWGQEILDDMSKIKRKVQRDKWLERFYELGGGGLPGCRVKK